MSTENEAEVVEEVVESVEDSGYTTPSDEQISSMLDEGSEVNDLPNADAVATSDDAAGDVESVSNEVDQSDLDSIRRTAEELGWATDDLADFESVEELRWFVSQFDKRTGKLEPTEEVPAGKADSGSEVEPPVIPGFDWSLDIEEMEESGDYTSQEISLAKHVRGVYEQTALLSKKLDDAKLAELGGSLKQFEEWKQQAEVSSQQQESVSFANSFHDAVDSLDESRFGRSLDAKGNVVKLSDEASANRIKLWEEIELQKLRLLRRGEQEPPVAVLAKRAENNVFLDDILKQTRKKVTTSLAKQSRRRQLTPSRSKAPLMDSDDPDDPANSPELREAWEKTGMADFLRK